MSDFTALLTRVLGEISYEPRSGTTTMVACVVIYALFLARNRNQNRPRSRGAMRCADSVLRMY